MKTFGEQLFGGAASVGLGIAAPFLAFGALNAIGKDPEGFKKGLAKFGKKFSGGGDYLGAKSNNTKNKIGEKKN